MAVHQNAGKQAPAESLVDTAALVKAYFERRPDLSDPNQQVTFGTSGHRGSSFSGLFNEQHILATAQAICDYRKLNGISGPLFMGKDTHALSRPAEQTALEVLAANEVTVFLQQDDGFTPTPVISHAIVSHNRAHRDSSADGIVITPSHNPPEDGGFKYNPPSGGPADTAVTAWVQDRANKLLGGGEIRRIPIEKARKANTTRFIDFVVPYVADLEKIIDFSPFRGAPLRVGADPLGGSSVAYWGPIGERYHLDITVVNRTVDPAFGFMPLDHDGRIRMDCSSVFAMAGLLRLKDSFDLAFGTDPDADRHGIVTPEGLMNPNHYLATAIWYLFTDRKQWSPNLAVGKTVVSSSIIDRVVRSLGRKLIEVPVGFKWFVEGLSSGTVGFGGEESAGACFLRQNGTVWCTDKDGIIMNLLAAEMTSRTGRNPAQHFEQLVARFGRPYYTRIDQPASPAERSAFKKLVPEAVRATTLGGEKIRDRLTTANNAPIGGLKVVAENGWFAARPSGTENIYKIYAESFLGESHLKQIVSEAQQIVTDALRC